MGWLIGSAALLLALAVLALLPVHVHLTFAQANLQAALRVEVRAAALRLTRAVSLSERAAGALEQAWHRWRERGNPAPGPVPESAHRMDSGKLAAAAGPGLRYLGRATRCSRLRLRLEVGGSDACESALLAGLGWSGAYILLAQLGRWLRLEQRGVAVAVVPNFQQSLLRTDLDCILSVRLGQAIAAVAMMLHGVMRSREVRAWLRDTWRRKGDRSGDRSPDSGPDEDSHGKP